MILLFLLNVIAVQKVSYAASTANENFGKPKKSIFEILFREAPLEITITTNLTSLIENRRTEDYTEGQMSYEDEQGKSIVRQIELQPRGKFRRRVCDFPPVRLKFAKKDLEAEGIETRFNKLKLVTHCVDDKLAGNDNLLKEYLVYQLYNELTPNSYRAQLVKVTYVDAEGKQPKIKRYGILLEDTDEMAARVGGKEIDQMGVSMDSISDQGEITMALFEYMIANMDWDTKMVRNVKLVALEGKADQMIPVPYDFDFSGLVNASYAIPSGDKGQLSIRDRVYLGEPFDQTYMRAALAHFIEKKPALLKKVKDLKLLSSEARQDVIAYLEGFYKNIEPAYADENIPLTSFFKLRNASVETWRQAQAPTATGGMKK
jgi:hypothetical protein